MSKDNVSVQIGPGFMGALGLLFIGLKLTGYINWSWWLVLLPLYGPLVLGCVIVAIIFMVAAFMAILAAALALFDKK